MSAHLSNKDKKTENRLGIELSNCYFLYDSNLINIYESKDQCEPFFQRPIDILLEIDRCLVMLRKIGLTQKFSVDDIKSQLIKNNKENFFIANHYLGQIFDLEYRSLLITTTPLFESNDSILLSYYNAINDMLIKVVENEHIQNSFSQIIKYIYSHIDANEGQRKDIDLKILDTVCTKFDKATEKSRMQPCKLHKYSQRLILPENCIKNTNFLNLSEKEMTI